MNRHLQRSCGKMLTNIRPCKRCNEYPKLKARFLKASDRWAYICTKCGRHGVEVVTEPKKYGMNAEERREAVKRWNDANDVTFVSIKKELIDINEKVYDMVNKIVLGKITDQERDQLLKEVDKLTNMERYLIIDYEDYYQQKKKEAAVWETKKSICTKEED